MRSILIQLILFCVLHTQLYCSGFATGEINKLVAMQADTCNLIEMIEVSRRCDGDFHYLTIDLVTEHEGSQFTVFRNGVFHRSFAYADLPVEIGPFESTTNQQSTLFFEDKIYSGCSLTTTYEESNCADCQLNSLAYSITNCRDGEFYFNFLHLDHLNTNGYYMLIVNDNLIDTFSYDSIPAIIGPIPDVADEYEVFIYDVMQLNCFHSFSFPSPICYPIECDLKNLLIEQTACLNEEYNLVIDFDYQGNGTFFELWIDSNHVGDYRYTNLPLTYGPLETPSGNLSHSVEVIDKDDKQCAESKQINIQDCRLYCAMSNLVVKQIECENGIYELTIDFDYENASSEFNLDVDGRNEGNYSYTELPLLLGPFSSTGIKNINVSVKDIEDDECALSTTILLDDCRPECSIYNVEYTELPCNESSFDITMNFDHDFTSNSFSVFTIDGSVNYGTFSYNELPLTIGSFAGDGTTRSILTILDSEGGCENFLTINPVLCTVSSSETIRQTALQIIPNPTNNFFTIENTTSGQVDLLSTSGIVLQSWKEFNEKFLLNDTPSGVYIVRWKSNEEVRYGRIVITQ